MELVFFTNALAQAPIALNGGEAQQQHQPLTATLLKPCEQHTQRTVHAWQYGIYARPNKEANTSALPLLNGLSRPQDHSTCHTNKEYQRIFEMLMLALYHDRIQNVFPNQEFYEYERYNEGTVPIPDIYRPYFEPPDRYDPFDPWMLLEKERQLKLWSSFTAEQLEPLLILIREAMDTIPEHQTEPLK